MTIDFGHVLREQSPETVVFSTLIALDTEASAPAPD